MRTKKVLLSETEVLNVARHFDFLEHSLCCMLYKVCNDRLIEPTTMSNVIGWLNLKDANPPICIKSKQKTRCCYLFKEISNYIINKQYKDEWILLMLKSVGISEKHYNAHTYEVGATKLEEDLNLIADIKLAIKRAALYSENYAKLSQYLNSEDKEES